MMATTLCKFSGEACPPTPQSFFYSQYASNNSGGKKLRLKCVKMWGPLSERNSEYAAEIVVVVVWRGISSKTDGRTKAEGLSFYHPGHQAAWVRC